ncbi:hypothetical protein V6N11_010732 [Hibiscus sabdariffa]|uniref:EamA domain-containing protein n=1 Tax=Hibiscus sabdariffa TaxID=183260 RepID=A0ABR2S655_9ROSI
MLLYHELCVFRNLAGRKILNMGKFMQWSFEEINGNGKAVDMHRCFSIYCQGLAKGFQANLHYDQSKETSERGSTAWSTTLTSTLLTTAVVVQWLNGKAKVLDDGMNHLVLITFRLSISTIFLAPIGYFWERNSRPKLTPRILCYLFFSAIVGASLTQYFFLLGIQYTSATFACAFVNMVPVITFIMALPFRIETVNLKSKSGRAKILGSVICVGGALLLTLYKGRPLFEHSHTMAPTIAHAVKLSSSRRAERWTIGCLALIVGTLLWSSWFIIQSYVGRRYPCQFSSTAIMSFFGAIQSAALSLLINRDLSMWVLKGKVEIITVLYAGMVGSGLSYVGMAWCVKKRGPVFTAAFSPLVQILAAMLDIPILHEQLNLGREMQNCASTIAQQAKEIREQETQLPVITVSCDSSCPETK